MDSTAALLQLVSPGLMGRALVATDRDDDGARSFWRAEPPPRHTHFARETLRVRPSSGDGAGGAPLVFDVDRVADLLGPVYLELRLPGIGVLDEASGDWVTGEDQPWWTEAVGHAAIVSAQLVVGNRVVDEITGDFLYAWSELAAAPGHDPLTLVGKHGGDWDRLVAASARPQTLYVPLHFFHFPAPDPGRGRHGGRPSLPLVALQFHSVRIRVRLRSVERLVVRSDPGTHVVRCRHTRLPLRDEDVGITLLAEQTYLQAAEREALATSTSVGRELLVTQHHQTQTVHVRPGQTQVLVPLDFNHPVRELLFFVRREAAEELNHWFNWSAPGVGRPVTDPVTGVRLLLDGADREDPHLPSSFYRTCQCLQHHSRIPRAFLYVYSFALRPEDPVQPSGSTNFGRVSRARLDVQLHASVGAATVVVMARSHNFLRLRFGLGGMRFA